MLLVDAQTGAELDYRRLVPGQTLYRGVPVTTIRSCRAYRTVAGIRIPSGPRTWTMMLADGRCVPLVVRWTHPRYFGRKVAFVPS